MKTINRYTTQQFLEKTGLPLSHLKYLLRDTNFRPSFPADEFSRRHAYSDADVKKVLQYKKTKMRKAIFE